MEAEWIVVSKVSYGDRGRWPQAADGTGHSLSLLDPLLDPSEAENWALSPKIGGTPGAPNGFGASFGVFRPPEGPAIRINEIRAAPDGFLELFNDSDTPVDLSGFFLSDDFSDLKRYVFPAGVRVKPYGFLAVGFQVFGDRLSLEGPRAEFALSVPAGDRVVDAVRFSGLDKAPSQGRFPDGGPRIQALKKPSPGAPNTVPEPPDLVISEISYHPITENDADEYIEIYNREKKAVDLSGFRFTRGIDFTFPAKAKIGREGFVCPVFWGHHI